MKRLLEKSHNLSPLFHLLLVGILTLFLAAQSFYLIRKNQYLTDQIESLKTELESNKNTWADQEYLNNIFLESASDYYEFKNLPTPTPKKIFVQPTITGKNTEEKLKEIDQKIVEIKAKIEEVKNKSAQETYFMNPAYRDYLYILNQLEQERRLYE